MSDNTNSITNLRQVGSVNTDDETRGHATPSVLLQASALVDGVDDMDVVAVDVGGGVTRLVAVIPLAASPEDLAGVVKASKAHGSVLASHMDDLGLRNALARYIDRQE